MQPVFGIAGCSSPPTVKSITDLLLESILANLFATYWQIPIVLVAEGRPLPLKINSLRVVRQLCGLAKLISGTEGCSDQETDLKA